MCLSPSIIQQSRRQGLWRLVLESDKESCLVCQTDFEEALSPRNDPRAQHINRGTWLAPGTHQDSPRRGPATPSPLVYPPSSFHGAWRSPVEIFLHHHCHHAIMLPELIYYFAPLAGLRRRGCHRAERVLNAEVSYVQYLIRTDREGVRLHQPR